MTVEVIELLKELAIAVPSTIAATMVLTAAIKGAFKIENENWVHAISWIVAVLCGLGFVASGQLTFGFGGWDYAIGAVVGLISGGAGNGTYDWPAIKKIIDLIVELFSKKKVS